jgi:EAL and modified HD-GYP domain-containing signal transduction protein
VLAAKTVDPARQTAVEAFNLAVNRAEVGRIERVLRRDAALCAQLLKFINSPAVGLAQAVHHIRHALVVLGNDKLARWLTLLLMTQHREQALPPAFLRLVLTRARFLELVALRALGPRDGDMLFMMGILSALDVLFGRPLAEALADLVRPDEVAQALRAGRGRLAPYLLLTLAVERCDTVHVAALSERLGLRLAEINAMQLEAQAWAGQWEDLMA